MPRRDYCPGRTASAREPTCKAELFDEYEQRQVLSNTGQHWQHQNFSSRCRTYHRLRARTVRLQSEFDWDGSHNWDRESKSRPCLFAPSDWPWGWYVLSSSIVTRRE